MLFSVLHCFGGSINNIFFYTMLFLVAGEVCNNTRNRTQDLVSSCQQIICLFFLWQITAYSLSKRIKTRQSWQPETKMRSIFEALKIWSAKIYGLFLAAKCTWFEKQETRGLIGFKIARFMLQRPQKCNEMSSSSSVLMPRNSPFFMWKRTTVFLKLQKDHKSIKPDPKKRSARKSLRENLMLFT